MSSVPFAFGNAQVLIPIRVWYCWTGYVSIFSPLINYGLGHIKGALSPWQYMYLVAGAITIVWGIVVLLLLPPDPIRAKGFNERERYICVARMRTNNSGVRNTHYKPEQVKELLLDVRFWMMFFTAFFCMIGNGPVSTFTPIIINSLGFNTLNSLLLVMPAGFFAGTQQLLVPYLAYKFARHNIRTWLAAICQMITVLASLLLLLLPLSATAGMLVACYILPSLGGAYAILMGLQIANIAGYTKRTVASSGIYIGYCLGWFSAVSSFGNVSNSVQETLLGHSSSKRKMPLATSLDLLSSSSRLSCRPF